MSLGGDEDEDDDTREFYENNPHLRRREERESREAQEEMVREQEISAGIDADALERIDDFPGEARATVAAYREKVKARIDANIEMYEFYSTRKDSRSRVWCRRLENAMAQLKLAMKKFSDHVEVILASLRRTPRTENLVGVVRSFTEILGTEYAIIGGELIDQESDADLMEIELDYKTNEDAKEYREKLDKDE